MQIEKGLGLGICKLCKGREEPAKDWVSPPASFLTLLRAASQAGAPLQVRLAEAWGTGWVLSWGPLALQPALSLTGL